MAVFAIATVSVFTLFIGGTQGVIIGLEKTKGFLLSNEALEAASAIAKNDANYLTPGKYHVGLNQQNQWVLIPKTGLVAHFLLANDAQDYGPNKHDGKMQHITFLEDRKSQPQAAAVFNGESSYIKTEYGHALQIDGPLTLTAWVLDMQPQSLESKTIAGRKGAYLLTKENNEYRLTLSGPSRTTSVSAQPSSSSGWQHLAAVYDQGEQTISLYVNGQLLEKSGKTNITSVNKAPGNEFFIGAQPAEEALENVWRGRISDVRVYSRALTANEIAGIYDSYSVPYQKYLVITDMAGELKGIWNFNEGVGCTIHDNSGFDNHGLVKNCSETNWTENRHDETGRALLFEEGNYIEIADSPALQLENEISISLWLKMPEDLPEENMTIFHKKAVSSNDFSFTFTYYGQDKSYGWAASLGPNDLTEIKLVEGAIANRWQHIIVTFDGNSPQMYLDNRMAYDLEAGSINNPGTESHLFMGQNAAGQNYSAGVAVDDLRVYNKILDSVERQAVFLSKTNYYLE